MHLSIVEKLAEKANPVRGFTKALQAKVANKQNAIIAECKKASPSKGLIREDFNVSEIALSYEEGGATCLSVLTDQKYFQGRNENIQLARRACNLPIIRKDFIVDDYQVTQARAIGADAILLIMACLTDEQAVSLEATAHALNLDVLVEVHDEIELKRALDVMSSPLLGINNRNLKTMEIDPMTSIRLLEKIPSDIIFSQENIIKSGAEATNFAPRSERDRNSFTKEFPKDKKLIICESGVSNREIIDSYNEADIYGFLIGEHFMRQDNIAQAVKDFT